MEAPISKVFPLIKAKDEAEWLNLNFVPNAFSLIVNLG
jgi:hypothetical protein